MIIKLDNDSAELLMMSLDCLIKHNDEYQLTKETLLKVVQFAALLEKEHGVAVTNYNVEPESDEVDPADKPVPPGHYQPLGSQPIKVNK